MNFYEIFKKKLMSSPDLKIFNNSSYWLSYITRFDLNDLYISADADDLGLCVGMSHMRSHAWRVVTGFILTFSVLCHLITVKFLFTIHEILSNIKTKHADIFVIQRVLSLFDCSNRTHSVIIFHGYYLFTNWNFIQMYFTMPYWQ